MKGKSCPDSIKIMKAFLFSLLLVAMICFSCLPGAVYGAVTNESAQGITIGFDPTLPPYQFLDGDTYQGFFIDLIREIEAELEIEIELVPLPLNESYSRFQQGKLDGIMGIRYFNELESQMIFSDSLVSATVSILMPSHEADQIRNLLGVEPVVIAVERNSIEFEFVKNIKKANFNEAFNQESVVQLLLMNRAHLMIGVTHTAQYLLEQSGLSESYRISNSYETPIDYYLALGREREALLLEMNRVLRNMKMNGTYEVIYNRWMNDNNLEQQRRIERNLKVMAGLIISAVALVVLAGYLNVRLKRKVDEKTREVSHTNYELQKKILEIKNTNELKDLMFESSPRSIAVFDNEGNISAMNDHVLKLCRLESVPFGQSIFTLEPLNSMLREYVDKVLDEGKSFLGKELEYGNQDRLRIFRYFIYPLNDYQRKTRGGIISIEDITDDRLLQAQVAEREKNRALIQLISGIAHEIRNPLTSIKTYAELVPRKIQNQEFQRQIAKVVPNEVERVSKLIDNLINYVKPRERLTELVSVEELVESCLLLFEPAVVGRQIRLQAEMEPDLLIRVDKNQMKQVLINLILNAIDAVLEQRETAGDHNRETPDEIAIRANGTRNQVSIVVADRGIGMNQEALEKVFELFYTTKSRGSGIGLPLSKQMIEENQGEIEIESRPDWGTKVTITFRREWDESKAVNY